MYRVGIIGCSGIGSRHADGLSKLDNVEIVACADLNKNTLENFTEKWEDRWNEISVYTDFSQMLLNENLDIVTVATSDHRHAEPVIKACEMNVKGIFCEKPIATNLRDAQRMADVAEERGTILSIDHTRRWQPIWVRSKEIVNDGEIGEVQYVIGTIGGSRAMLFRNGTHLIDMICYFANSKPSGACAKLEIGFENYTEYRGDGGHDPKTEPGADGYIQFENGTSGFYVGRSKQTPQAFRLEVVGSEGTIFVDDRSARIEKSGEIEEIEPPEWEVTGIQAGVIELVKLVDEGGTPISPVDSALHTVEIMISFLESQRLDNTKINFSTMRKRMLGSS